MTRPTDRTDQPDAVPPPELNPLVNPLLAQNMGRWAEVYFNNPPEKREEAVQNLLREIKGEQPQPKPEPEPEEEARSISPLVRTSLPELESSPALTTEREVICPGCGHYNPPSQRFCGMCGAALAETTDETGQSGLTSESPEFVSEPSIREGAEMDVQSENSHYFLDESPRQPYPDDDHMMFESVGPSFSYGYRVVIGLFLAIAIGALAYMAWRGSHSGTDVSQASSQPAPVADQPALPTPAPSKSDSAANAPSPSPDRNTSAKNEEAAAPPRKEAAAPPAAKPESAEPITRASDKTVAEPPPARKAAHNSDRVGRSEKVSNAQPSASKGAEELAMAQRYLNAGAGQKRDPAQAADWLWKSVAKQNPQATLLLADLYLRGDGIQKNCDQARVLLDAAARKGQSGAGQRLRNMQAFGCR